jgi:septum formation protein
MELVLASSSPRRRELLAALGIPFMVVPPPQDEAHARPGVLPAALACELALAKVRAVAALHPQVPVLGADTVVALRGRALGKPVDHEEAIAMLRRLRNRWHRVVTAIALAHHGRATLAYATSWVHIRPLPEEEIRRYVEKGEPFDKAGGYAIQDQELRPVDRYLGCYCNVVGLSLALVVRMLKRLGVQVPSSPPTSWCEACPLWARIVGPERPC